MVQYSPVDIRIHHQSAADHQQIMHIWILCQNVLSGNISFSRNQDQKQNEVNRCLFPITMIVSIDFRPFSEWKSENFQNVLSGNGGSGNHRMLLLFSQDQCRHPWAGLCSGRGECECNRCGCRAGYSGQYCQETRGADTDKDTCTRLAPCILKEIYQGNEMEVGNRASRELSRSLKKAPTSN